MMASIRTRVLFIGLALSALGVSVIALNSDRSLGADSPVLPTAVEPEIELPTAAELERRSQAIPQPSGEQSPDQAPIAPLIANPQR